MAQSAPVRSSDGRAANYGEAVRRVHQRLLPALPPRQALALGAFIVVVVVTAAVVIAWLAGPGVTMAFGMGVLAGTTAATSVTDPWVRVWAGLLFCAAGVGGSLTSTSPWACAAVVVLLALAQAPLTASAAGIAVFAPVIAAVFASVDVGEGPLTVGLGVGIGFIFVQLVTAALRLPRASAAVPKAIAWRHAAVFAFLAGPAVLLTRTLELDHGYWLVLTLAVVLQPSPQAAQNVEKQAHYGVLAILFLGSGGSLATGVDLGLERLGLTAVAVALAVGASTALRQVEAKP